MEQPGTHRLPHGMTPITAYCMEWHLAESGAFQRLLVEPLRAEADVVLRCWDGNRLPEPLEPEATTIFCQLPPPEHVLREPNHRVVWLPMEDQMLSTGYRWWWSLPRWLRVVAFSSAIARRARSARLRTLRLRYYTDPTELAPATWDRGPRVFYWNRTGMVGPLFLEGLCSAIGAKELIFRGQLDPRVGHEVQYDLPEEVGGAAVTRLDVRRREGYIRGTEPANVFIAPRVGEGVGLTFLEAMARGCCVLAYDAPTMNEYVTSGRNGILVRNGRGARSNPFTVSHIQPWNRFRESDLRRLGDEARMDHASGRRQWLASLSHYRRFVLGDVSRGD